MKVISISALILSIGFANGAMAEDVDLSVVNRIKDEAFNHSQVMNYVHYLADENGARLATSPDYRRAARWAVDELRQSGISEARLEEFDSFGRSWAWSAISVQMLEPLSTTLIGVPLAWSLGTDGPVTADVVYAPLWEDSEDPGQYDLVKLAEQIESYKSRYRGQLGGVIVLLAGKRPFEIPSEPEIQRWSEADLADMQSAREPSLSNVREWPQLQRPADHADRTILSEIVPRNDWGTDHMAFDAVGLPSFDLLQDQLDYWSHTHHSNVDTVDHVLPKDLMISAAFLATLVYQAATRDELMPREPLPLPLPELTPLPGILRD